MCNKTNTILLIKNILFIFLSFISIFHFTNIYAESGIVVEVTEKIPGANCDDAKDEKGVVIPGKYNCTIEKGFGTVVNMLGNIIEYFTYIAGLGSVLYLIINGIIYSMSGLSEGKDDAKKRIKDNLVGIVLLLLSGPILYMIAPWIYKTV